MNLIELSATPDNKRDDQWENQFLKALTEGKVNLLSENPIEGPDGWPYLLAEVGAEATESVQNILNWAATRGVGLVINPTKEYPDYVLSYGMIWSFRQTGWFFRKDLEVPQGKTEFDASKIVHAGTPTEEYLPGFARKILREFLVDQGVIAPKILMVSQDRSHYDLAFSLESLRNPPAEEWEGVAEAIGWFLPPHYSILLVSEKGLPEFSSL